MIAQGLLFLYRQLPELPRSSTQSFQLFRLHLYHSPCLSLQPLPQRGWIFVPTLGMVLENAAFPWGEFIPDGGAILKFSLVVRDRRFGVKAHQSDR